MAINATTGIDPEVDRFAIWRASTSQYINLNATWPRADGGPIQGGNPDYQYFKRVETERPDSDHRYTVQTTWDRVATDPVPDEGHPLGEYRQSHAATKLSNDDLKIQVDTAFQAQVRIAIPETDLPSELAASIDAIVRKQNGDVLTEKQNGKRTKAVMVGDILSQLETRRDELYAAIDAGEDYDLTEGWTVV